MNRAQGQSAHRSRFADRLRESGILLFACDQRGEIVDAPRRDQDWLADVCLPSPIVRLALSRAVATWSEEEAPAPVPAVPGLWLVPMPRLRRRRVEGYRVAMIVTCRLLGSEELRAICQSTRFDFELCQLLIQKLPPAAEEDVPRLAALTMLANESRSKLAAEGRAMESVGQQLAESYEEINLLYNIIQSMTVVEHPDRFVTFACGELLETLPYAWIGMVFEDDAERLKKLAGRFLFAGRIGRPEPEMKALVTALLGHSSGPLVIEPARIPAHAEFVALGQTTLVHPIRSDRGSMGLLFAADKQGEDIAASSVDMKLLGATASHTAIFLENAALYDDLNAMFLGTLEALTASIDAKDRYTCGHSQRVAALTQQLSRAIGLDEQTVSRMHIAGLVHDVGKIGVPERVLLKPGKLTDEEYAWIRKHPEIGHRILKDIPQLRDILPGVLYHHERWDGFGYPHRVSGEDIPMVARLIALADSFDAMSSTRTYRTRLSRDEVLAEILRCAGTQFDPSLVPVFVELDFNEFDRLVVEHHAIDPSPTADPPREEAA